MAQLILTALQPPVSLVQRRFWETEQGSTVEKRDFQDIVTQTDFESQTMIVTELTRLMKIVGNDDLQFIGEENLTSQPATHAFVIDPIDGTNNFANKLPYCCISVGYLRNGVLHTGVVMNPITGEYWWATKGMGSHHVLPAHAPVADRERVLQILAKPLNQSVVIAHTNGREYADLQFNAYRELFDKVQAMRNFGAMALDLCYLASNGFQVVLADAHALWDIAGAYLIVTEAGGSMCDYAGAPIQLRIDQPKQTYQVVASHPSLTQELLRA